MPRALPRDPFQTTAQRVADAIRDGILRGDIQLGEKVYQTRVADQLGVSQSIVREALLRLEREGFVHAVPYKGVFVRNLNDKDVHELFTLRSILEPFALRQAMASLPVSEILKPLSAHFDDMLAAVAYGNSDSLATIDLSFHTTIIVLSGHALLHSVWSGIAPRVRLFLIAKYPLYDSPQELAETHRPVLEAIASGDADKAACALGGHITDAATLAIKMLQQRSCV